MSDARSLSHEGSNEPEDEWEMTTEPITRTPPREMRSITLQIELQVEVPAGVTASAACSHLTDVFSPPQLYGPDDEYEIKSWRGVHVA